MLYLPPLSLARRLIKSYFDGAGWTYTPLNPRVVEEDILPLYYPKHFPPPPLPPPQTQNSTTTTPQNQNQNQIKRQRPHPHELALLCMVLSVGALVDVGHLHHPRVPSIREQHSRYYVLARASLALKSPLVSGSIRLVECLSFMIIYAYVLIPFDDYYGSEGRLIGICGIRMRFIWSGLLF